MPSVREANTGRPDVCTYTLIQRPGTVSLILSVRYSLWLYATSGPNQPVPVERHCTLWLSFAFCSLQPAANAATANNAKTSSVLIAFIVSPFDLAERHALRSRFPVPAEPTVLPYKAELVASVVVGVAVCHVRPKPACSGRAPLHALTLVRVLFIAADSKHGRSQ